MKKKLANIIIGIILLSISIYYIIKASNLPRGVVLREIGPGLFPIVLGTCLGILSIIMIILTFVSPEKIIVATKKIDKKNFYQFLLTIGVTFLFLIVWRLIGIYSIIVSIPLYILVNGYRKNIWIIISVTIGFSLFIYLVFFRIFGIILPDGIIF